MGRPRRTSSRSRLGLLPLLLLFAGGCEEDVTTPGGDEVVSVTLSPPSPQMAVGEVIRLDLLARNPQGIVLPPRETVWLSSDTAVASVDSEGLIRGSSEGEATISATVEGVTGQARVVVTGAPAAVWREHSCGVDAEGRAWCWGRGANGELGNGSRSSSSVPVSVAGGHVWSDVSVGASHTCGLTTEGEGLCWGRGAEGQLGSGSLGTASAPRPLHGDYGFRNLSAGGRHACGVTTFGDTRCWGWNTNGQLGNGVRIDVGTPIQVNGGHFFTDVSAGGEHTCALEGGGRAWCWGANGLGQLGDGTRADRLQPVPVSTSLRFRAISAGARHTCAIDQVGEAWCWGDNRQAQLGNGTVQISDVPQKVRSDPDFRLNAISAGAVHTCGVRTNGVGYCWGSGSFGQLGNGTRSLRGNPTAVERALFRDVTAGAAHTCGLSGSGALLCWGLNVSGQLGTGDLADRLVPEGIALERTFARVGG